MTDDFKNKCADWYAAGNKKNKFVLQQNFGENLGNPRQL